MISLSLRIKFILVITFFNIEKDSVKFVSLAYDKKTYFHRIK